MLKIRVPLRIVCAFACALATGLLERGAAGAETVVAGDTADLRLAITDSSVDEVLGALGSRFGVSYRANTRLDRRLNGELSGPLKSVVARVLKGYDFIIRTDAEHIDVVVLGAAKHEDALMLKTRRRSD